MASSYDIKADPSDHSYEPSSGDSRNSSPAPVPKKKYRSSLAIQKAKSEIRHAMSRNKSTPKLSNVVDSLLQKNEQLLAQNDAITYKPNSRAPRGTFDSRRLEGAALGETTFLVSQQSQARITKTQDRKEQDLVSGRLLRPRSPTRKSIIADRDKTALNTAIMESDLNDKASDKLFRVNKHEMISAVSCNAMFSSKGGKIAANIDLTYYWCNFCPYSTTSKHALLHHLSDHRFTCKYCDFQSYSRACVIKHSAKSHEEFTCMATSLKYCTVLTDYLKVNKQPKVSNDDKKRKAEDDDDEEEESSSKVQRLNADDDEDDDSQSSSNSKQNKSANDNDYEFFDMEVEEIEENNDHNTVTEEPHIPETIPVHQLPRLYPGNMTNQAPKVYTNITKPNKPTKIQSDQDILYQQYATPNAAMQILPDLDDDGSTGRVQTVTSPRTVRPKPAPKFAQQKAVAAKPTVSSSLYWSCGYCSFKSDSQWKIKHHSVSKHPGKPHRYVALILPPGTTHIENEEEDDKDIEVEVNDESDDSNSNQSSGSVNGKHSKKKKAWKVNLK